MFTGRMSDTLNVKHSARFSQSHGKRFIMISRTCLTHAAGIEREYKGLSERTRSEQISIV